MDKAMTTPAERAKEFCLKYKPHDPRMAGPHYEATMIMMSLLASLESVQRDAEGMAEQILDDHIGCGEFVGDPDDGEILPCTCPACTVARKYTK